MSEPIVNLHIWDKLRTPPADALKKITGGRLAGKSDINPQWRWQALTEVFGPCGVGWMFEQVERWTETGATTKVGPVGQESVATEVMAFVRVRLRYRVPEPSLDPAGNWSEWVYGLGGSMLIENEKGGPHNNDEAWKMAETDALGNAAKYLGLAADVYRGMMDGSKYNKPLPPVMARPAPGPAQPGSVDQGYLKPSDEAKAQARAQAAATPPVDLPDPEHPACPNCSGPMYDNRADNAAKGYTKSLSFKCKDKGCMAAHPKAGTGTSGWYPGQWESRCHEILAAVEAERAVVGTRRWDPDIDGPEPDES